MVIIRAPPPVESSLPNGASAHPVGERQAGRKGKKKEATRMLPKAVKTSCGVKATIVTTQMEKPKPKRCFACGDHHVDYYSTANDADGKVIYLNCLSVCEMFLGKSPEERADLVQLAEVCPLCLDWTKDHRAKDCRTKDEQGKMFEPCKQLMENGSPCGDWHNSLLHGTTNKYCNPTKKKPYKKPSVEEEQAEEAALREAIKEQNKKAARKAKAALRMVVRFGQKISACERSILA